MEAGKWLKENAPGSVAMYREPGGVSFYSEGKVIQIPLDELDRIIMVMKFYKVTHIIPYAIPGPLDEPTPSWVLRPAIKPLVEGEMPGLKLVYDGGLKIYEIQYDLLPAVEIDFEGFGRSSKECGAVNSPSQESRTLCLQLKFSLARLCTSVGWDQRGE